MDRRKETREIVKTEWPRIRKERRFEKEGPREQGSRKEGRVSSYSSAQCFKPISEGAATGITSALYAEIRSL
jgi:hypothetical protein